MLNRIFQPFVAWQLWQQIHHPPPHPIHRWGMVGMSAGKPRRRWLRWLLIIGAALVSIPLVFTVLPFLLLLLPFWPFFSLIGLTSAVAGRLAHEQEIGNLDFLLVTPLPRETVLWRLGVGGAHGSSHYRDLRRLRLVASRTILFAITATIFALGVISQISDLIQGYSTSNFSDVVDFFLILLVIQSICAIGALTVYLDNAFSLVSAAYMGLIVGSRFPNRTNAQIIAGVAFGVFQVLVYVVGFTLWIIVLRLFSELPLVNNTDDFSGAIIYIGIFTLLFLAMLLMRESTVRLLRYGWRRTAGMP